MGMVTSLSQSSYAVNMETYFKNISGKIEHFHFNGAYLSPVNICSYVLEKTSLTSLNEIPSESNTGMFFGSGGGTPSSDDYCLSNPIEFSDDGLSIVKSYCEHNVYKDTFYIHTRIIKNQSSDPITVNECGLFSHMAFTGYNYSPNCKTTFLWARETFDSITIQPGEVRSCVMTISI